jgi:hypothetical protein
MYIRLKIDTNENKWKEHCVRIYPLPCLHVGAAQSDVKFIKAHLKRIQEDENALAVYMGDGGECVTKFSKGDVYTQVLNPQQQVDQLVTMLKPLGDKLWFGIRGNHGHRIFRDTGLSFDKSLCSALGIPYMGVNAFANLIINRSSYDLYFHHGIESGVSLQSKVTKAEAFKGYIDADAIFTAHSHIAVDLPPAAILSADNHAAKVHTKLRHQYVCGTGYDSRSGYAVEHGYPPLLPAFLVIELTGSRHGSVLKQTSFKYSSDGQHAVNGDYGFLEREDF